MNEYIIGAILFFILSLTNFMDVLNSPDVSKVEAFIKSIIAGLIWPLIAGVCLIACLIKLMDSEE